jgi:hypothetical protein
VKVRVAVWLLGALAAGVCLAATGQPVHAQPAVPQPPGGTGLGDLLSNPGKWLITMFNEAIASLGEKATADMVGFMGWLLGNGNVISQTPPALSYDSEAVGRLWDVTRAIANSGLAVVTVWGGVNMMIHPQIRAPYHGALELVPRVVLSGILVNTSLYWGHFVIDVNNALCAKLGASTIPAWNSVLQPSGGSGLLNLIAITIYVVMGLLLLGQMLMRLALLDALLVVGPLALLCWVLPQTYSWARLWFSTFFGTVFVQSIQVLVLQLGAELIKGVPGLLPKVGSDPVEAWRMWLVTLLLGVAILQLARKVPALMPGYPGGGGMGAASGLGAVRFITTLVRSSAQKGGR